MTEGVFPELVRVRPKERGGRWGHASPFMRGSTIVRSQTFSPGARSQYVCRVSLSTQNYYFSNICTVACSLTLYHSVLTPISVESFSYIAATVTAQLYQRNRPSSGTRWKEEHCGISRYRHIIMSLVFTFNSVKYVVSEGGCVCVCVIAAVVPLLPGRAADTYLPGPGAGSPGLQDASEAADGGADRTEGAEAATGGAAGQGGPGAPPLGPEGRALPLPAQRGPETGWTGSTAFKLLYEPRGSGPRPAAAADSSSFCCATGQPKQTGATSGGGGREEAEEGFQRGSADEGAEPEGASAGADVQVGIMLPPGQLSHCYTSGNVNLTLKQSERL